MNRARKSDNHVERKKRLSVGLGRECKVNRAVNLSDGRRSCLAADYAGGKCVADAFMQNFNYVLGALVVCRERAADFFRLKKANVHFVLE